MSYTLDKLKKKVDKKYGKDTMIRASEYPKLARISTGILSMDLVMGGGIPRGRSMIFTGMESTSKTTAALSSIASFQNTCRECLNRRDKCECKEFAPHSCVFLDVEGTFDKDWARSVGVNLEELYLSQPQFSEQAVDIVEAVVRAEDSDLIVLDSIAMMSPIVEVEKSAEDKIIGDHAKLVNRMCRAVQAGLNSRGMLERKPSVIMINQVREKVGVNFGSPIVLPGGKGQLFSASIIIKLYSSSSDIIYDEDKQAVGADVRMKVQKNKTYPPHKEGIFRLFTDDCPEYGAEKGDIDRFNTIVRVGKKFGLIEESGSWFTVKQDGEEVLKEQGIKNMTAALKKHPELAYALEYEIRKTVYKVEVGNDG